MMGRLRPGLVARTDRTGGPFKEETSMSGRASRLVLAIAVLGVLAAVAAPPVLAQTIALKGAVQFNDDHAFNKTLLKFEELVKKYYGKPINFVLHRNSELGLEKDYFAFMSQGLSVDYAIVAPSHMSTFSKAAPIMDMPFLFRDLDHWNKVLDGDALQPIAEDVAKKADVMLIGYAGGGTRNIIAKKPVRNMAELKNLTVRVMGAPIQTRIFQAITAAPTVIAYNEVYNAIQTGVIQGAENEAAGLEQMKFYEVGPEISLTQHAITIRPLCFSGKTFRKLPKELQDAILRAGKEAGAHGRQIESTEDQGRLERLQKEGKLRTHVFTERAKLLELAEPVKQAYAKEIEADKVLARINAVK
jgi:TRAP-type C4-dicarboxylate transport system substrate-binding protein